MLYNLLREVVGIALFIPCLKEGDFWHEKLKAIIYIVVATAIEASQRKLEAKKWLMNR
jgi:hypothetical protein